MSTLRGFLGNGGWLIAVHTKKCTRERRKVTPSERARSLIANHQDRFANAAHARADQSAAAKTTGEAA